MNAKEYKKFLSLHITKTTPMSRGMHPFSCKCSACSVVAARKHAPPIPAEIYYGVINIDDDIITLEVYPRNDFIFVGNSIIGVELYNGTARIIMAAGPEIYSFDVVDGVAEFANNGMLKFHICDYCGVLHLYNSSREGYCYSCYENMKAIRSMVSGLDYCYRGTIYRLDGDHKEISFEELDKYKIYRYMFVTHDGKLIASSDLKNRARIYDGFAKLIPPSMRFTGLDRSATNWTKEISLRIDEMNRYYSSVVQG